MKLTDWMKANTWLAWLLLGVAVVILLWLVFRPAPSTDNSALIKSRDSLLVINKGLRKTLQQTVNLKQPQIDSLLKLNDSLQDYGTDLQDKLDDAHAENRRLANNIIISMQHHAVMFKVDGDPEMHVLDDSDCYKLALQVIADSAQEENLKEVHYRQVLGLVKTITDQDSIIVGQHNLIISDSLVQSKQLTLSDVQEKQIKKLKNRLSVTKVGAGILIIGSFILGIEVAK